MAEDGVIYTYLAHPAGSLPSDTSALAQHHTCPQCPLWHRIALWVGWAGNIVLLGAVLVLAVLEGSGCKLCPRHWAPYRDKCYWFSEENEYWSRGRDDCSWRGSHLLVIQDQEELEFTQNLTGNQNPVWIGLNITSQRKNWTWVDGSPLNQTLFTVSGPAEENSCAAVKKNQIKSEICNTHYKWICQKEAVLI
ncbi:killer cell lectin-like receptor subfamily F member 1 [Terrapene carolina triunguis]|uniref:killer cell lectin-like receptor subfamily F member 1 n=1 Tax=Terrapene triunguis TaxID=2587831 RepID=UPI000E7784D6|nr:killer cell lectin-like receptor subfamily F member 1 [Terrapene carolina triunguis]